MGTIDDVRIYDRALSPDQIAALFTGGNTIAAAETAEGEVWQAKVHPFAPDRGGFSGDSNALTILDPSGVGDETLLPARFLLHNSVPNPFNPMTVIKYDLPVGSRVSLRIFDVSGRLVTVLKKNVIESVGQYAVVWDGRDGAGQIA